MRELIDPSRGMVRRSIAMEWPAAIPFVPVLALLVYLTCAL